jgi:hypothetical protein|tara:strand:+ start:1584 stop:1955 length:372 start_codon:yes stop_codon:yes gene_type:complete
MFYNTIKHIWLILTLLFLLSCAEYNSVTTRSVTREQIIKQNIKIVSDPKLVEDLIYIDEYMTSVRYINDYKEIQNLVQKNLVRHGWSNVTVYVEVVEPGFRDIDMRRGLQIDRAKTIRVSIYK